MGYTSPLFLPTQTIYWDLFDNIQTSFISQCTAKVGSVI